ncbi:hypothetical protein WJX84_012131 [Apatococcus fuscideae]|uniref:Uncharacterized protein n=1 Tax=Apatococcus fuscideae TaxID=2026836 RepID=A0AAW1SXV7_9CHLO
MITDLDNCRVQHPCINAAMQLVREAVQGLGICPYNEAIGTGELRYLQLTAAGSEFSSWQAQQDAQASVQVVLIWNDKKSQAGDVPSRLAQLAENIWKIGQPSAGTTQRGMADQKGLIHSVWANYQPARDNTIMGPDWQHLHGPQDLWQSFGGALVNVPPGSFVQANFGAMEAALAVIANSLPPAASVADLHAGVGTIGLSLIASGRCSALRLFLLW